MYNKIYWCDYFHSIGWSTMVLNILSLALFDTGRYYYITIADMLFTIYLETSFYNLRTFYRLEARVRGLRPSWRALRGIGMRMTIYY